MRCMTWMQPLHAEQTIDTMTETPAPYRVTPNADYHADYAPAAPPAQLPRAPLRLSCVVPAHNEEANLEDFVRALAQAVAQGECVLRAVARAAVQAHVGQFILAPLERRRQRMHAITPLVLEQVVVQARIGFVGRGPGLVIVARLGELQLGAVLRGPLRLPVQAQRLHADTIQLEQRSRIRAA